MMTRALMIVALLVPALGWARDKPAFQPVDESLLGIWRQVDVDDAEVEIVELTPGQCAYVTGDQLQRIAPVVGQIGDELVTSFYGRRSRHRVTLEGDTLTTSTTDPRTSQVVEKRYRRLESRPEAFDLKPFRLGDAGKPVAQERIAEIKTELVKRGELDQEVRMKMHSGQEVAPGDIDRMNEIDRDNTAWLIDLVTDIGWIDRERFGEAAREAFLIVQHSGRLPLMLAALPALEKEAKATGKGGAYALLYDRTQLWIGRKQRYGSQIGQDPDGMYVAPLEDPEHVDERRAELGMEPLADYMERFRSNNDGKDILIREEF